MNIPFFKRQLSFRSLLRRLKSPDCNPALPLPLVAAILLTLVMPVSALAAGQPQPAGHGNHIYIGNMHEGIVMENDPDTGDRIIQVTPSPKPEGQGAQENATPIIIAPEVKLPQRSHYGSDGRPVHTDRPRHP